MRLEDILDSFVRLSSLDSWGGEEEEEEEEI